MYKHTVYTKRNIAQKHSQVVANL